MVMMMMTVAFSELASGRNKGCDDCKGDVVDSYVVRALQAIGRQTVMMVMVMMINMLLMMIMTVFNPHRPQIG